LAFPRRSIGTLRALDAAQRAHRIWRTLVSQYEPPPIDGDAAQAVDDYVERRKREGGAPAS